METLHHKELEALIRITSAQVAITKEVEGINLDELCGKMLRMHSEAAATDTAAGNFEAATATVTVHVDFQGNKVGAIKAIRQLTGSGLKEAKDLSDLARRQIVDGSPVFRTTLHNVRRNTAESVRSEHVGYYGSASDVQIRIAAA